MSMTADEYRQDAKESVLHNLWEDYLEQQSDQTLANIFQYAMFQLANKFGGVDEFVRKKELIQFILELDYTGEFDASGFEDFKREQ